MVLSCLKVILIYLFVFVLDLFATDKLTADIKLVEYIPIPGPNVMEATVQDKICDNSVCFLQVKKGRFLRVIVSKPIDHSAEMVIKFPDGSMFKKAADKDQPTIVHSFELSDIHTGMFSIGMHIDCADCKANYGLFALYVWDKEPPRSIITTFYKGSEINNGDKVSSGFFIFAESINAISPYDTISFCVLRPRAKTYKCSIDNKIKFNLSGRGKYIIQAWSDLLVLTRFELYAI